MFKLVNLPTWKLKNKEENYAITEHRSGIFR